MRIVFMGTPSFAAEQLRALYENRDANGWEITGVLCQPDKPRGRGHKLLPPPVKEYALSVGLPVFQPLTFKDGAYAEELKTLKPELIIVAAYGKILPPYVLDYPKYGCINVHGSLLPRYRGAAPIQRAIINGETETGITIMYMAAGLDTGDMLAKTALSIGENEDFGSLYDRMGKAGAELLIRTIPAIVNGTASREAQNDALSDYAAKIEKEDRALDFHASARALHNRIRALSPDPLTFATLKTANGTSMLKIVSAYVAEETGVHGEAGAVLSADAKKGCFTVACGDGVLAVTAVVPEGKGSMSAGDFIRGRKISAGDMLF